MPNKPVKTSKQEAIRFGDELRNKLKAEAEKEGRSFSGMVKRICELYLAGRDAGKGELDVS